MAEIPRHGIPVRCLAGAVNMPAQLDMPSRSPTGRFAKGELDALSGSPCGLGLQREAEWPTLLPLIQTIPDDRLRRCARRPGTALWRKGEAGCRQSRSTR